MEESEQEEEPAQQWVGDIEKPQKKRRMSFEQQPTLLNLANSNDEEMFEEMDILQDPNTCRPSSRMPKFSNANDDIELERRRREAKTRRIMGFLYSGNLPHPRERSSQKHHMNDVNVGSDITPEKEEEPHRNQMKSPMVARHEEEEKEFGSMAVAAGALEPHAYKSEMIYDESNPLNVNVSNKSVKETIRSESPGLMDEDRVTEAANLLEKVKRNLQKEMRSPFGQEYDIIKEAVSERSNSRSIVANVKSSSELSVVENAVLSSDKSEAPPPSNDGESDPEVISHGKNSS